MNPIFRLFELTDAQRALEFVQRQIDDARELFPDDDEYQEMLNSRESTITQQRELVRAKMYAIASSN
jgi:CHASE3 domain sensor protein